MATTTYKILAQSAPAATTATDLYTVPAATETIVSTISVCNRSTTDATYRISVSPLGAATANKDYIVFDATAAANGFVTFTIGLTLAATDKIRGYG